MFYQLIQSAMAAAILTISIGLSDAIEYIISPYVHKIHNCPDIMEMPWANYNAYHAFMSGVKCSWFLMLPLIPVLGYNYSRFAISCISIFNILLPVPIYLFGLDLKQPFLCHHLLYLVNPIVIIAIVIQSHI